MNTIPEHDRKLAETLRSLSLDDSATSATASPVTGSRIALACLLLFGAAALVLTFRPAASTSFKGVLTDGPDIALTSHEASGTNDAASKPTPLPLSNEITGSGYLIAPRSTMVFAKYQGQIKRVDVELGDRVAAGQPLVILDDASTRFSLEQAKIAHGAAELVLAATRITLDQAQSSLRRKEALADVLSKQDVEDARTAWSSAQNTVAQAQQDLDKALLAVAIAQEQVDALTVRAPIAGVVTRLGAHVGDTVLARADSVSESQSLVTIVDQSSLMIEADVAETNIAALRPGLAGEAVLDGFPDRPFAIEIVRLAPVVSSDKGTISLRLVPKTPPEGIRPGMAARIRLSTINNQPGAIDP